MSGLVRNPRATGSIKRALVTGSGGLIGSACVHALLADGWQVAGIDSNARAEYFGDDGSTAIAIAAETLEMSRRFTHYALDIRNRDDVEAVFRPATFGFIIHTAAQPSHDRSSQIPIADFETNAAGTLYLLEAARKYCPEAPFAHVSTSKVYGDNVNRIPLIELERRYCIDIEDQEGVSYAGIAERFPIDHCMHTLFGCSKLYGDLAAQEYGRYFAMPVGVFRGNCQTGPGHAAVPLHGYLNYIVKCAVLGLPYTVLGYKGKQVRDQIHADDVARLFLEFYKNPRADVFNYGGGRGNSISILETIDMLDNLGYKLNWEYRDEPRKGDHVVYYTDNTKVRAAYPAWGTIRGVPAIVAEIVAKYEGRS